VIFEGKVVTHAVWDIVIDKKQNQTEAQPDRLGLRRKI